MKLNKYKFKNSDTEFLIYTMSDELSLPLDDLNLELVTENPSLEENKFLQLIKAEDLLERILTHKRTRDVVLAKEVGLSSQTISRHLKKHGIKPQGHAQIK